VAQTVGLDGDDFLSRRHLLFLRQRGGYVVRLFDNTNGASHNGAELTAGVERPLAIGDRIALGAFTVIRVTAIRS
jgi:predicted component of type VI protein secretion system